MMNRQTILFISLLIVFILSSCKTSFVRNKEAHQDDAKMESAILEQAQIKETVYASAETDPVKSLSVDDDAADDPAIWYNEENPQKSIIYGSDKLNGIHTYSLSGKALQYIQCGKINNIDVRQNIKWGNKKVDLLAGSNRTDNSISIFIIDEETGLIHDSPDYTISLGTFSPYGFCLYRKEGNLYAFANSKSGEIRQLKISNSKADGFSHKMVRKLKLKTQVEGMVVDDQNDLLYVGEEEFGIYIFSAIEDGSKKPKLMKSSTAKNNPKISYDIEGLALLGDDYLIASSQGNFSYAIFDRKKDLYVTSFKIIETENIDGVIETDGIDILSLPLGDKYKSGILVVQDGFNYQNKTKLAQNFKIVDLEPIYKLIEKGNYHEGK